MVFFDIDGTLFDENKQLPQTAKRALAMLKENGVFTAIATGRAPFTFESLRKELDIDSYVSFNGQYVVFENKVIYKNPLSLVEMERLVSFSQKQNHPLVFMDDTMMKGTAEHHPQISNSIVESLKLSYPEIDLNFYKEKEIYQALLFCEETEDQLYCENFPNFRFIRWHEYSTDILPSGGSKAEGIKRMVQELGFQMEDVYAFGDGLNDIEMLQTVGTGVAMGNALAEVKEAADIVSTSVEEDGIWNGLKKLSLI